MRNAYAILGVAFIIVFGSAFILYNRAEAPTTTDAPLATNPNIIMALSLTSPAFADGEFIPSAFTCDGENMSPELRIDGVPEGAESLVLVMDDPDIPAEIKAARGIEKFNHWAVYNLSPDTLMIPEGAAVGAGGLNSRGDATYTGPCPPTEYEPTTHRYIFRLYALSGQLNFVTTPTLDEVEAAAAGSMLEKTELVGRYSRVNE